MRRRPQARSPNPRPIRRPTKSASTGGYDGLVDPDRRTGEVPVFWAPDLCATTVILTPSPGGIPSPIRVAPGGWPGECHQHESADGLHLILREGRNRHRIWLPGRPAPGEPLAAIIPMDRPASIRSAAAMRLRDHLSGMKRKSGAVAPRPKSTRLAKGLQALDGRLAGASYREIAEAQVHRSAGSTAGWKTDTLRDTTIRLVQRARALMKGGYRALSRRP